MNGTVSRLVTVCNDKGLHARASAKFVECAEMFDCEIRVTKENAIVDGKSILDLLTLGAGKGCLLNIEAEGQEARNALEALDILVRNGFGE